MFHLGVRMSYKSLCVLSRVHLHRERCAADLTPRYGKETPKIHPDPKRKQKAAAVTGVGGAEVTERVQRNTG